MRNFLRQFLPYAASVLLVLVLLYGAFFEYFFSNLILPDALSVEFRIAAGVFIRLALAGALAFYLFFRWRFFKLLAGHARATFAFMGRLQKGKGKFYTEPPSCRLHFRDWANGAAIFAVGYGFYILLFVLVMLISENTERLYPSFEEAKGHYLEFTTRLATVSANMGIVEHGYPDMQFTLEEGEQDWAYLPLYPYAMRLVRTVFGISTQASLWLISVLALFFSIQAIYALGKLIAPWLKESPMDPAIFAVAFGFSPLLFHANFMIVPMALFLWMAVLFVRIILYGDHSTLTLVVLCLLSAVLTWTRFHGIILNVSFLGLAALSYFLFQGFPKRHLVIFAAVNLFSLAGLCGFYYAICGEPLAFSKIQAVFSRKFTWPWQNKHLVNVLTGNILSSRSYEAPLILFRIVVFLMSAAILFGTGCKSVLSSMEEWKRNRIWYLTLFFGITGLVMAIHPIFLNLLHAYHRLSCYGVLLLFFMACFQPRRMQGAFVLLAFAMQVFSHVLFITFHPSVNW